MNPILASLADLYPAGTPAECLVYAPTMACAKVELQTGWKKARLRRKSVQLDEHGLGKAALPFTKPGVYPVRIVFGGQGVLAQNHVFIGKPNKSPLSVALTRCVIDPEASTLSLALKIAYNRHLHQGKLRLELLSPQRTINAREIEVINGLAETTFPLPNEGPLFLVLHTLVTERKTFLPLPETAIEPTMDVGLSVPETIERGDPLTINISGGEGSGLLVISDARCATSRLQEAMAGSSTTLGEIDRQDLQTRLETDKLPGFVHAGAVHVPICQTVSLSQFSKAFTLRELFNARQWRVRLYVPQGDTVGVSEALIDIHHPPGLSLDFPEYVAPGDEIEGIITYSAQETPADLVLQNGTVKRKSLYAGETGETSIMIKGEPDAHLGVSLISEGGNTAKETWENDAQSPFTGNLPIMNTRFARRGDIITSPCQIYPGPEALIVDVTQSLLAYPHGCAEQTSSKLGGLALLLMLSKEGYPVPHLEQADETLQNGLTRMDLFEKTPGAFSLWEDDAPDLITTQQVYRNLSPFQHLDVPDARKMLLRLEQHLAQQKPSTIGTFIQKIRNIPSIETAYDSYFQTGAPPEIQQQSLEHVINTAQLHHNAPHWNEFTMFGATDHSACMALRMLHHAQIDTIDVIAKKNLTNTQPHLWQRLLATLGLYRQQTTQNVTRKRITDPVGTTLNQISATMPEGRFYSTATTRLYIELLMDIRNDCPETAIRFQDTEEKTTIIEPRHIKSRPFEILSKRAILVQWTQDTPPTETDGPVRVETRIPERSPRVGESFDINMHYEPQGAPVRTPVLNLQLPAHLHLMETDSRIAGECLNWELPLRNQDRRLRLRAVRRG
ncbi:MAG: hypothetical protein QGG64_08765, partial [Candidatus Latescibacteria bacterium]|nr:hypothetical protein [Candidatus Latescibacterota bacterium]